MKLPLSVDKIDAIPEAARGAYTERDGKFVLEADIEDVSGIKAKNQELIGRNKTLAARAALLGERSDDEIKADLEFAAEQRKLEAERKGRYDDILKQAGEKHAKELDGERGKTKRVTDKLYDVMARREVERAITDAGGNAKVMLPHILPFVRVAEVDDDFAVQVVDAKGKPRIADGQANPMSIEQLVEAFKGDETFADNFKASGATGGGARNQQSQSDRGGVVLIPKDATPQEYRRLKDQAIKEGKQYRIAS